MIRYTTPTITLTVEGVDLTEQEVYVTLCQRNRTLTIEQPAMALEGEDTVITVPLTQVQTGGLAEGTTSVQVNWLDGQGHRDATEIGTLEVGRNLLAEVV